MTDSVNILIDRDNANDEEATVVKVYAVSGTLVHADEPVFDVENSKATIEVIAPAEGVLVHALAVGDAVPYGVPVARIVPPGTTDLDGAIPFKPGAVAFQKPAFVEPPATPPKPVVSVTRVTEPAVAPVYAEVEDYQPEAPPGSLTPRFSHAAAALAAEHGLAASDFRTELVTSRDVQLMLRGTSVAPPGVEQVGNRTPILPRKREEIEFLRGGAGDTMLSVLGCDVGPITIHREPGTTFSGKITDLVVYEASRLVRKYPRLNAAYHDNGSELHACVNAGIAFDEGGRLVVYGVENADKKDLLALRADIEDALSRYMEKKLSRAEITRATFTISDLSSMELDFILPLLPRGQSLIVGVTRNPSRGYSIYAGFDHRVTEGLEVAKFLTDLRDRLRSFSDGPAAEPSCWFCGRSAREEVEIYHGRGLIKVVDAHGEEHLACNACWRMV